MRAALSRRLIVPDQRRLRAPHYQVYARCHFPHAAGNLLAYDHPPVEFQPIATGIYSIRSGPPKTTGR